MARRGALKLQMCGNECAAVSGPRDGMDPTCEAYIVKNAASSCKTIVFCTAMVQTSDLP